MHKNTHAQACRWHDTHPVTGFMLFHLSIVSGNIVQKSLTKAVKIKAASDKSGCKIMFMYLFYDCATQCIAKVSKKKGQSFKNDLDLKHALKAIHLFSITLWGKASYPLISPGNNVCFAIRNIHASFSI